jgi:hypothetical protein
VAAAEAAEVVAVAEVAAEVVVEAVEVEAEAEVAEAAVVEAEVRHPGLQPTRRRGRSRSCCSGAEAPAAVDRSCCSA